MYRIKKSLVLLSVGILCFFCQVFRNSGYKPEKLYFSPPNMVGSLTSIGSFLKHTCKPKQKVGFLKMHKCASSTVQNIFSRYAYKNDLNLILPLERKSYVGSPDYFSVDLIEQTPWHHLGYHILNIHTRWNHSAVKNALRGDPALITIVREPVQQFESMYSYLNFYDYLGYVALPDFIRKLEQNKMEYKLKLEYKRKYTRFGRNQMLFDLGYPVEDFDNEDKVKHFVEEVNKNFHLVMITEKMEESIVLLKHLLCWDYKDLVFLKLNARHENLKVNLSEGQKETLRNWLRADNYLYKKLRDVFDKKVEKFGRDRMEEEKKKLASKRNQILEGCFPVKKVPTGNLLIEELRKIAGCRLYGFFDSSELNFLDLLKSAQWKRADMKALQSLE